MRENYLKNKGAYKRRTYERIGRIRGASGSHTFEQVREVWARQWGLCLYCKTELGASADEKSKYHRDHVVPISKGGSDDISNIQLLCPTCNKQKSTKSAHEFAQEKFGRLF